MKFGRVQRMLISSFLLGMYLFAALLSQNFHDHGSENFFKDFQFKKTEKSVSNSDCKAGFDPCLSCHFLHEAKTYSLDYFDFQFDYFQYVSYQFDEINEVYFKADFHRFYLRGPPHFA